jgi:hypothetical protein
LGADWQALTALWLRTETVLSKSGHTDLTFNEICTSSTPNDWKEWMNAKLMKTDAKHPAESFGQVLTDYLKGLPSSVLEIVVMGNPRQT